MVDAFKAYTDFVLYYGNIGACFIIAAVLFFYHRNENEKHDFLAALSAMCITIASIAQIVDHIKTGSSPSFYELIMNVALAILFLKGRGNVNKSSKIGLTAANVKSFDAERKRLEYRKAG